ncbi:MAG: hypothetical protein RBS24_06395 [Bacilli bacterium]|nr:hypothetical protein [Bacilli bacterium]
MKKHSIEKVRDDIYNISNGEYKVLNNEYVGCHFPLDILHISCGNICKISYTNFITTKNRCTVCLYEKQRSNLENIQKSLDNLYNGEYRILKYGGNNKSQSTIEHLKCGFVYTTKSNNILSGNGLCPICVKGSHNTTESFKRKLDINTNFEYSLV